MTETDVTTGPLAFAASFPPEDRFALTAAEIAGRLAVACGCAPGAADDIRGAVDAAFRQALSAGAGGAGIELTLRAADGVFDADVASGGTALCHCSRQRSG